MTFEPVFFYIIYLLYINILAKREMPKSKVNNQNIEFIVTFAKIFFIIN